MKSSSLPKNAIITGVSALSAWGLISYVPSKMTIEMPKGTKVTAYSDYKITTQSLDTFSLGKDKINDIDIYSPERLIVELNKFDLENTIKAEAIRNLEQICNPYLVKRIYDALAPTRRNLDHEYIKSYLLSRLVSLVDKLKNYSESQQKDMLREYLLSRLGDMNIPVLIKGGSSIELFSEIKRSTLDIDAHVGISNVENLLANLTSKDYEIYFELTKESEIEIQEILKGSKKKNILKINLIPKTRSGKLKEVLGTHLDFVNDLSLNLTYTLEQIREIITIFKLSKRKLKFFNNKSCLTFSREMLLAEKFQSLISKPENTQRTKDLIDLKLL